MRVPGQRGPGLPSPSQTGLGVAPRLLPRPGASVPSPRHVARLCPTVSCVALPAPGSRGADASLRGRERSDVAQTPLSSCAASRSQLRGPDGRNLAVRGDESAGVRAPEAAARSGAAPWSSWAAPRAPGERGPLSFPPRWDAAAPCRRGQLFTAPAFFCVSGGHDL